MSLLKWGSAYTHVGVRLVLPWPWKAYHQDHNCFGFLADICKCHSGNIWHQLRAVELYHFNIGKCVIHKFFFIASCTQAGTIIALFKKFMAFFACQ
jgi:hypothetical protein